MKIMMIECNAEELRANRTVMDSIVDAMNNFTGNLFGVNKIDWSKLNEYQESEDNEEDTEE